VVRRKAGELDEAWPVTHAKYANPKPLRGQPRLFADLRRLVLVHTQTQFHEVIRIVVSELYAGLGKVRNCLLSGRYDQLPRVTMRIALMAELMHGLAHEHIYTAAGLATAESMTLTPRPADRGALLKSVIE
jgi:KNTase C-terminal domain